MNGLPDLDDRLVHIRADARRLATCLEADALTTPIPTCPGWDLRRLGVHTGYIHRWATHALQTAAPPAASAVHEPDPDTSALELAAWIRLGSGILVDILAVTRTDAPTWHPFPGVQIADFWSRRMMIETALHRWDAENATIGDTELDPRLAASGVDEYFELGLPRVLSKNDTVAPASRVRVVADQRAWVIDGRTGDVHVTARGPASDSAAEPVDGTISGSAEHLLLVLMGRADRSSIEVHGVGTYWLDLPSW